MFSPFKSCRNRWTCQPADDVTVETQPEVPPIQKVPKTDTVPRQEGRCDRGDAEVPSISNARKHERSANVPKLMQRNVPMIQKVERDQKS